MNQLVTPNLNVPTQIAKCLKYVQDAFGSPNAGRTATVSWNTRTLYRHFDREFPTGVYFLVWFDYYATIDGSYENFGHVVICKDGVCYSSPYRAGQTSYAVISSISEVERIYGCTFVGWSEDIAGLKVIEGEDMKATANDLKYLYLGVYAEDIADDVLAKDPFVGTDMGEATMRVLDYANTKGFAYWQYKPKAEAEIETLKARIKELEDGGQYVETKVYIKKV